MKTMKSIFSRVNLSLRPSVHRFATREHHGKHFPGRLLHLPGRGLPGQPDLHLVLGGGQCLLQEVRPRWYRPRPAFHPGHSPTPCCWVVACPVCVCVCLCVCVCVCTVRLRLRMLSSLIDHAGLSLVTCFTEVVWFNQTLLSKVTVHLRTIKMNDKKCSTAHRLRKTPTEQGSEQLKEKESKNIYSTSRSIFIICSYQHQIQLNNQRHLCK